MNYLREFEVSKVILRDVGSFLKSETKKILMSYEGRDIKIELDSISERLIVNRLKENFPYSILSEEMGKSDCFDSLKPYWVLDPIDGTLNYFRNNPSCCISLALYIKRSPIIGLIYDFNNDEMFSGLVSQGAWLNDISISGGSQLLNSHCDMILATGISTYSILDSGLEERFIRNLHSFKKIRIIGSAALSLAYVAANRFDAYYEEKIMFWDVAAGLAINSIIGKSINVIYFSDFKVDVKVGFNE